jgi:hypothetical protein
VLEEDEQNDDNEGDDNFVLISTDKCEIEEDCWDLANEDDDSDYYPHEHIEYRTIVKNKLEEHYLVCDFSDISEINKINALSQLQFNNMLLEN